MSGLFDLVLIGLLVAMTEVVEVLEGTRRWALVCADNEVILPLLPDKSVAHCLMDPPYEAEAHTLQRRAVRATGKYDGGAYAANGSAVCQIEALSFAALTEADRSFASGQIARLTQRWAIAFCQVEAVNRWSGALVQAGMNTKRIGIWVKPDAMPQFSGDRPGMGYESIVFAHAPGRSRWNGGGRVGVFIHNKNSGGKHVHETQKPLPLMLELVGLFSDPDEVVLDPFAGSGTTGVACLRLGRRFIGIEKSPEYAAVARERLEAESQGLSLRAARAGQLPLLGAL